jgi:outer membrane protein OmpA-like peptidoglycan-associated protein
MHPDGKTLYFSSQGHNTMGGFDIFKSVKDENGLWSSAQNIGFPINTTEDDLSIVVSADGQTGYYSSIKSDGYGDKDIYRIKFSETDEVNTEQSLTLVKGVIIDKKTRIPIEANIEIVDNEKQEIVANFKSNEGTGEFLVSLPVGKNYGLTVVKDGYLFHSENFDLNDSLDFQSIDLDISLDGIDVNSTVILRNIFFDYGKDILKDESKLELSRVLALLEKYPKMKLEISGHTDNVSSYKFNLKLSKKRAQSVANYLINNGVDKYRLIVEGYAFNKPIAENETKEGRIKNRRVEFKVLGY